MHENLIIEGKGSLAFISIDRLLTIIGGSYANALKKNE